MGRGSNDLGGFGALYDRYFPQVYRFLYAKLKDPTAVESAATEVFFEAFKEFRGNLTSGRNFPSRLYELAAREILAHSKAGWTQGPGQPLIPVMSRPRTDTRSSFRNFHGIAIVRWRPRWQFVVQLGVLSLVLFVFGLALFGAAVAITHGGLSMDLTRFQVALQFVLIAGLGLAHELIHALVRLRSSARPRFGVALWLPRAPEALLRRHCLVDPSCSCCLTFLTVGCLVRFSNFFVGACFLLPCGASISSSAQGPRAG